MEEGLFIFFTGCLFMALLYHFALYLIQKTRLLLLYSAYLFAATLFLAERVWIQENDLTLTNESYFYFIDEPIQLLIYITYFIFSAHALDVFSTPDKKFIALYRITIGSLVLFTLFHLAGMTFNWFDKRTIWAFVSIRIIMLVSVLLMFQRVSKYIKGLFFKFILAGSLIMMVSGLLAFLTSLFDTPVFGIYGVMWSCLGLVLDVICFSAALGYKAKVDIVEKREALQLLIVKEKELQQQELEKINAVYEARDADRNRIARDLHDEIGSTLSSIHIYSSVAEKTLNTDPAKTQLVLQQINNNTRMIMENMSDIVWAMKTGVQAQVLLSNKIKNVGYEMLDAKNIRCRYEIADSADHTHMDVDLRRNILLIVKESLNNVIKYSGASEVTIKMKVEENTFIMCITDNGNGFDDTCEGKGNGLMNMRYRVKQHGGSINISSAFSKGTHISCIFPIANNRDKI